MRSLVSTERLARAKHLVTERTFENLSATVVVVIILAFLAGTTHISVASERARRSKGFVTFVAEVVPADIFLDL